MRARWHTSRQHSFCTVVPVPICFAGKLNGLDFRWSKHFIPGSQLMIAERIQRTWPGRWEEFCDQLLPGFRKLKAEVLHRRTASPRCCYWISYSSPCFKTAIFSYMVQTPSPTPGSGGTCTFYNVTSSDWMIWHATQLHAALSQLQQQADDNHRRIISHTGRETVMDRALAALGWLQAKTSKQAWELHHKMAAVLKAGNPVPAISQEPAPPVKVQPQKLYLLGTEANSLQLLWSAWTLASGAMKGHQLSACAPMCSAALFAVRHSYIIVMGTL